MFSDRVAHSPIVIDNDIDFLLLSFNGSGTESDPYTFDNFKIIDSEPASYGISIYGTTKFFIIRNCYINADSRGIDIHNVAENTAKIINNTCNSNSYCGIVISSSSGSFVVNNTCINNSYGIVIQSSSNCIVSNNYCADNTGNGLGLIESHFVNVVNNQFTSNDNYGIIFAWSETCTLHSNTFQENKHFGVFIRDSSRNVVFNNTFIENNQDGYMDDYSQGYDSGRRNSWYNAETKQGNLWSDLGDTCRYKIDGSANSKDIYPLNRELSCPNPIAISAISIVIPIIIGVSVLAFVFPMYIVPYIRENDKLSQFVRKRFPEKKKAIGLIIWIVLSFAGAILLILNGAVFYMWGGTVGIALILLGSFVIVIALSLIFIWIRYPEKLFKPKTES
jgi:parallel beta-helix repeat protein